MLFIIAGAALILTYEKGNEILYVSQIHTHFFNQFFIWVSRFAELPLLLLIVLVAFVSNYGNAILILLSFVVNGAITQFLKAVIFTDQVRPIIFFEGKANLNLVDGLQMLHNHSFPSGHTSSAFAVLFMIALLSKDKRWGLLLFVGALLVGISRVYLMQHFFRDIYFGSILGVLVSVVVYLAATNSNYYSELSWREKRIIK